MNIFDTAVIILCITALFAYINKRFIGLPTTIGVMIISLMISLIMIVLDHFGVSEPREYEISLLSNVDFYGVLMDGMLSLLLFASALHVNFKELRSYKYWTMTMAFAGTLASTLLIGFLMYYGFPLFFGWHPALIWCLIFGALISPTDPIAVIGILKSANAPKSIEMIISGESLLNDGMGIVLFTLFVGSLSTGVLPTFNEGLVLLLQEAVGGFGYGALLGYLGYLMIKSIDSYQTTILLTLALTLGGYEVAETLHVSGPLAMVSAGLFIGNAARETMKINARQYLDAFWELIDEILNAILFVLIGLEIILVSYNRYLIIATVAVIIVTLISRFIVVWVTTRLLKRDKRVPSNAWQILTWGGLRGGVSVALALSLPEGESREVILALTYGVVLFSILFQGLTVSKVAKKLKIVQ